MYITLNIQINNKVLTLIIRTVDKLQDFNLPLKKKNLKVVVCPGYQGGNILNNVYLVISPEGMCFAHTCDQSNAEVRIYPGEGGLFVS